MCHARPNATCPLAHFTPTASRAIYSARACGDGGALSDDSDADNEFNSVLMKPEVTRAGGSVRLARLKPEVREDLTRARGGLDDKLLL